ncbi:MATE family efflux transporter [Caldanaerobacter sp.]|uniref:MATE family efflux transporter n=1 Tax=Caldanaerobacter sp. TaxID=2930036 RepID=UPI003C786C94
MEAKEEEMRNVAREVMQIAWPSIAEQMLVMAVGMISTIFVGRISPAALAAVGLINMVIFFLQAVFAGLSTGVTVVVARLVGEQDTEGVKTATLQSFIMAIFLTLLFTLLGYAFDISIIKTLFGKIERDVFDFAILYYRIALIGFPFMVVALILGGALRGAGDTKTPMYVSAVVNIINLILNFLLVFGVSYGGGYIIPPFGVKGAAWAVTIARVAGGVILAYLIYFGKNQAKIIVRSPFKLDFDMMKRIIRIGIPASLEQLVMQGGFLVVQIIVSTMGTTAIAVYQIGMNANSLAFMPIFGFSIAATALVGRSLGAEEFDMAETYAKVSRNISIGVISAIGVFMFVFSKQLAALYTTDPEVIRVSASILKIFAVVEPFLAIMVVMAGVLRAAGDISYVVITTVVGLWLFRIVMGSFLAKNFGMGIYGIWIGVFTDFIVRSIMYIFRFRAGKWKYIKV